MPRRWPKRLTIGQHDTNGGSLKVHRTRDDIISPPGRGIDVVESKCKKDDYCTQRDAEIEARRRQEVQPGPPVKATGANQVLEYPADKSPRKVVERRRGRDVSGTAENERRHCVLQGRLGPTFGAPVDKDRDDGAEDEEEQEA